MHWRVAADFFDSTSGRWIDGFVDDPSLSFEKVPARMRGTSWHFRRRSTTGAFGWLSHLNHAWYAWSGTKGVDYDGLITCFPQLALSAALIKRIFRIDAPLVAWTFNIGKLQNGWRRKVARFAAPAIDRLIVHSPSEIKEYSQFLGLPEDRFVFVPLQRPDLGIERKEDLSEPFLLAMGSAHRDYNSLLEGLDGLGIRTIIVANPFVCESLPDRPWLTKLSGLDYMECWDLLSRARISVTPISNLQTASGQVTFVMAMHLGVPVICTRCPGAEGYIDHNRTGLLVPAFDAQAIRTSVQTLWEDAGLRMVLSDAAKEKALMCFSDEAAGRNLKRELVRFQSI